MNKFYKIYIKPIIMETCAIYASTLMSIYIASFLSVVFDKAMKAQISSIKNKIISFFLVILFYFLMKTVFQYILSIVKEKSRMRYKTWICSSMLDCSYEFMEKMTFGEVQTLISYDTDNVCSGLGESSVVLFVSVISIVTYFTLLLRFNLKISVLVIVLFLVHVLPTFLFKGKYNELYDKYEQIWEKVLSCLEETITGFVFIKQHNVYKHFSSKYEETQRELAIISNKIDKTATLGKSLKILIENVSKVTLYAGIVYFMYKGYIKLSDMVYCIMICEFVLQNGRKLFEQYDVFRKAMVSVNRLKEISKYGENKHDIYKSDISIVSKVESLKFCNVDFSYEENKNVILQANFIINDGDKILITGQNGSGKSTLVKLILGVYKNWRGCITVDGVDLKNLNLGKYRQILSYLPQQQFCLGNHVVENLYMLSKDRKKAEIYLKLFDLSLDKVKDTKWDNLSGGEKQKICIIRTMLKDSNLIILDEPTNNLDKDGRKQLCNIIENCEKTIIVISHDDEIHSVFSKRITIDQGKVLQRQVTYGE